MDDDRPAAITAPAPIESPLTTVAPMPTKTSSPIVVLPPMFTPGFSIEKAPTSTW